MGLWITGAHRRPAFGLTAALCLCASVVQAQEPLAVIKITPNASGFPKSLKAKVEAAFGEHIERDSRHRRGRWLAGWDLHQSRANANPFGLSRKAPEDRYGVLSPSFAYPD